MLGTMLTSIIGLVAKGKAAKAIGGSIGTLTGLAAFEPVQVFLSGIMEGMTPGLQDAGSMLGAAMVSMAVGYVMTWFAPKNAPEKG